MAAALKAYAESPFSLSGSDYSNARLIEAMSGILFGAALGWLVVTIRNRMSGGTHR